MTISNKTDKADLYLDFSQFHGMRKLALEDKEKGLHAAAKQMESVFLNMMLKSMREANAVLSEGSLFESKESEFYQEMYDKQLSSNLSAQGGIGLADIIVSQLGGKEKNQDDSTKNYDITQYLENPINNFSAGLRKINVDKNEANESTDDPLMKGQEVDGLLIDDGAENVVPSINLDHWQTPKEFVRAIYPHAKQAAQQLGVEPEALIAQAALETGWGKHVMNGPDQSTSFNLFGIKADSRWQGEETNKNTLEYRNGIAAKEMASFRSYESLKDAFTDYVSFLKNNGRYESILNKKTESKQWGFELQQSGYATDPKYGNKIASILESDILQSALKQVRFGFK